MNQTQPSPPMNADSRFRCWRGSVRLRVLSRNVGLEQAGGGGHLLMLTPREIHEITLSLPHTRDFARRADGAFCQLRSELGDNLVPD